MDGYILLTRAVSDSVKHFRLGSETFRLAKRAGNCGPPDLSHKTKVEASGGSECSLYCDAAAL
jgi:hypothetical protein